MKRLFLMFALIALLVLPVMVSAGGKSDKSSAVKQTSEQPASVSGDTGQKRSVEIGSQATDATSRDNLSEALRKSIDQYNQVNPQAIEGD